MKKWTYLQYLLCFAYVARCHNDIPLDISLKIPKGNYVIEEVKLLRNARELLFTTILDEDTFSPITNAGVPIDPELSVVTSRVELLRTTQKVFIRMKTFDRETSDGKILMLHICYCYENGGWVPSDSKSYMEHKMQYMKRITASIPFTENDDIKVIEYGNILTCIAKYEYAFIDKITKNGRVLWSSADSDGNRIIQIVYKRRFGIVRFRAAMVDPDNNAWVMTFLVVGNSVWASYDNIDKVHPRYQEVIATVDSHYMTQRKFVLMGNAPFTPTSPFDFVDTQPVDNDMHSNHPLGKIATKLANYAKSFVSPQTVEVDLASVDLDKCHCFRIYHFSCAGVPYSLTSDVGYVFGKVKWNNTLVFNGLKHSPFYIVYYKSRKMQILYTFALNDENIERAVWKRPRVRSGDREEQWDGTIIREENYYPPPLTLDISRAFDSRFYVIAGPYVNQRGATYLTSRREFKIKAIADGDVTIHVFKRAQRPTVEINRFLPKYIRIFNPGAKAANDQYVLYKKGDDSRWVQVYEDEILHP